jgi:hypothetical protein
LHISENPHYFFTGSDTNRVDFGIAPIEAKVE